MNHRANRAFTLVELLITVSIISILAGLTVLASLSASDNAKAAVIISDMRNMKSAATMYRYERGTWPVWIYTGGSYVNRDGANGAVLPDRYLSRLPVGEGYWVGVMKHPEVSSSAVVAADVSGLPYQVKEAIAKEAQNIAIYGTETIGMQAPDLSSMTKFKPSDKGIIWIISK
jgi:prepilin-type N-terminal cleavage/methylation domain-containing protein